VAELFNNKFQINGNDDRTYLDLQSVAIEKLINNRINKNNIIDVNHCTCCSDEYHSYRRNGKKAGRMIAMMGWKQ